LDERHYIATRTPETAVQELVPIAEILREVAELAPSEQADQALVLRTLSAELFDDARRGKRGGEVMTKAPTLHYLWAAASTLKALAVEGDRMLRA
jgi:hypothetical protein